MELELEPEPKPESKPEPITTPTPETVKRVKTPTNRLLYQGETKIVMQIWIKNLLLSMITCGMYNFWGKTHLRRYTMSHMSLGDDPFEYTGNGFELFKGFAIGAPIALVVGGLYTMGPPLLAIPAFIAFLCLMPTAIYMSTRYRLNRMTWRGIRGHLEGSAFKYGMTSMWYSLLNFLTTNIIAPYVDLQRYRYKANNVRFGNLKGSFHGKSGHLIGIHLASALAGTTCAIIVMLVTSGLVGVLVIYTEIQFIDDILNYEDALMQSLSETTNVPVETIEGLTEEQREDLYDKYLPVEYAQAQTNLIFVVFPLLIVLSIPPIIIFMIFRAWYKSELLKEKMNGLRIGHIRFKSTAGWGDYAKFQLGNAGILIVTLGLGRVFILQRRMTFLAKFILIGGDLNSEKVTQAIKHETTIGEGLDDIFGLDIGIL